MPTLPPAGRAALLGLAAVTVAALTGAGLHLTSAEREARAAADRALVDHAQTAAAALAPAVQSGPAVRLVFEAWARAEGPATLVLFDGRGRVAAATDRAVADALRAPSPSGPDVADVRLGAEPAALAARAVGDTDFVVAAVRRGEVGASDAVLVETAVAAAAMWSALVALVVGMAWYAGPAAAAQLGLLGQRVAQGDADGAALVRHARGWLGPLADAFLPVAARFRQLGSEAKDVQEHLAALYQINPNYVVLCTFGGKVVEANPAFYAVTGLAVDALRNGRVDALQDAFPVEPLMDFAHRSLREGSAITGVEYALVGHDDKPRPVEVSIRAFEVGGEKMALFQAADRSREKTLERRIAAFHDSLDLMVDQRVQEIEAGQESLRSILDGAGVVVASFDASGATTSWNGAAEGLAGRPASAVPHVSAAAAAIGLSAAERTEFTRWFWSTSDEPFIGRHDVADGDGAPRTRQIIWLRVDTDDVGQTALRTLIGVEVPADLDLFAPVFVTDAAGLSGLRTGRPASA